MQEKDDASKNTLHEEDKSSNAVQEQKDTKPTEQKLKEASLSQNNKTYSFSFINEDKVKTKDTIDFIPVTSKDNEKSQHSDNFSNEIPQAVKTSHYNYKKKKVGLFGSQPSSGFRSSTSLTGYHASTSPENFFKKKYTSAHLKKAQRRVKSETLDRVPKSELFQHIMAQYRKGGIRKKKKTLRKRKHRRHRSKSF